MRAKQKRYLNFGAKIQTFEKGRKNYFWLENSNGTFLVIFKHCDYAGQQQKYERSSTFFDYFWCGHQKKNVLQIFATIVCKNANPICVASCPFFSKKNLSKNTWQSFAQKSPENRVSQSIFGYCFLEKSK